MMTIEQEVELTREYIQRDKLNRRQLAIRAKNAQENATRWRSMGSHFAVCANGADATARAHLFELIDRNSTRR